MKENYTPIKMIETDYAKLVEPYKEKAIKVLEDLININSVYDESTASRFKPFGTGVEKALSYVATLGTKLGFRVDRCDNYATELSYGHGSKVLDIYAHLDVVPVNKDNWSKDPFKMEIEDGNIYGRGSCDDKGPAVACLFATKALIDQGKILGCKVRFIFGGNEESGSLCLEHYFKVLRKAYPTLGFSPDADYPLIYAEKSMLNYVLTYPIELPFVDPFDAGDALNIVLDTCKVHIRMDKEKLYIIDKAYARYKKKYKGLDGEVIKGMLVTQGVAAHGSMPQLGINAGLHMLNFLGEYYDVDILKFIFECYNDGLGKNMGISYKDEDFSETTYNVGRITYTGTELKIYVNCRFPVSVTYSDIISRVHQIAKCPIKVLSTSDGFVFKKDSPLIKNLISAYQEETGDLASKPLAIGGGTYARESKNSVAFGAAFPKRDYRMHGDDEYFPLDDFYANMQIYANAIDKLTTYLQQLSNEEDTIKVEIKEGEESSETKAQKVDKHRSRRK